MRLVDDPGGHRARSFAGVADGYDYARPSYPPAAVRWLLGPGPLDVLDLGAGTGKLTSVVVDEGHRVVAVEPLGPLRAKLSEALPAVEVLAGRAEEIPRPDGSADAVLVGQAFHWFEAPAAVAEIARVLRPGGRLGLLWNVREHEQEWAGELAAIAGHDGVPGGWAGELAGLAGVAGVERRDFRLAHPVDRAKLVALVATWSTVATLEAAARERVLGRVGDLWDRHPGLGTGAASLAYRTEAYRLRLA
jgi:SAM-dependent methyltransferase